MSVSQDVSLEDAELASTLITSEAGPGANIIWGVSFDPDLEDGFDKQPESAPRKPERTARPAAQPAPAKPGEARPRPTQPKPQRPRDDDDFGGLFDMMRSTKKQ